MKYEVWLLISNLQNETASEVYLTSENETYSEVYLTSTK